MRKDKIIDYYYEEDGYEASMVIHHFNNLILNTKINLLEEIIDDLEEYDDDDNEKAILYIQNKRDKLQSEVKWKIITFTKITQYGLLQRDYYMPYSLKYLHMVLKFIISTPPEIELRVH